MLSKAMKVDVSVLFMYNLWKSETNLPKVSKLKKVKSEHIILKLFEPEMDGYVFLHGVALIKFKGRMYCAWAHNKVRENSDDWPMCEPILFSIIWKRQFPSEKREK